jgi:hypothetical protein
MDLRGWFAVLGVAALVACGTYSAQALGVDGGTDAQVGPKDGAVFDVAPSTLDATPLVDAGADAAPKCALPSLLKNGDFENGGVYWTSYGLTVEPSVASARTGLAGGKLCMPTSYSSLSQVVTAGSGTIRARLWHRTLPDSGAPKTLGLGTTTHGGAAFREFGRTTLIGPGWTCFEGETSGDFDRLQVSFEPATTSPECLAIDDVDLFLVPDGGLVPPECRCPVN